MVFGFNFFSRSLGTDDLIRSSKELEQITKSIQKINNKDTVLDKIVSRKHLLVVYVSYLTLVYIKAYDARYKYAIITGSVFMVFFFQFYLIKPFVSWVQLKRLSKLRKRHEYIINTLKDRSKFENINTIINRFTFGQEHDQDYKQILDDDIKSRMKQLAHLNTELTEKKQKMNNIKNSNKSTKSILKRFIDNVEDNDDEIIHNLIIREVFQDLLVEYCFVCECCGQSTKYYVRKEEIVGTNKTLSADVKHCLKCKKDQLNSKLPLKQLEGNG